MVYYWEISCVHYYHCVSNRDHLTKKVSSWYTPSHWHFVVEGSNMESSYTCIFHSWIFQRGWGGGGYEICGLTPTVPLIMPLGGVFVVMFKWKGTCCKKRSCYLGTDFCNTVSTRIDRDWWRETSLKSLPGENRGGICYLLQTRDELLST